jgi:hypothetical protein
MRKAFLFFVILVPLTTFAAASSIEVKPLVAKSSTKLADSILTDYDFEIPRGTLSFQIQAESEANAYIIHLVSPSGEKLIGETLPKYSEIEKRHGSDPLVLAQLSRLRVEMTKASGVHAVLVPNYEGVAAPGHYSVRVQGSATVKTSVLIKRQSAPSKQASLRMRLILVAEKDRAKLETLAAKVAESFSKLGIRLQTELILVPRADEKSPFEFLRAHGRRDALNILLINYGGRTAGFSLGRPGAAMNEVSAPAGVLVNLNDGFEPHDLASVLVHESGHYLGLPHNCEVGIALEDEISDTRCSRDNPMYGQDGFGDFTPGQISVLLKHPLVVLE